MITTPVYALMAVVLYFRLRSFEAVAPEPVATPTG